MNVSTPVAEILNCYAQPLRPVDALEGLENAGGLSGARIWRYRSALGTLCLRAWPRNGPGRLHLEQVHLWLNQARGLPFVPVPFPASDGRSLLEVDGAFWELSPWMPGVADHLQVPEVGRVARAFEALAVFHRALEAERVQGVSPGLMRRAELLRHLQNGGLAELGNAVENAGSGAPELQALARQWLEAARSVVPPLIEPVSQAARWVLPLQPCLRDARRDHFLFSDDRVTGLVDFGSMGMDCIAADLARLMGDWLPATGDCRAQAIAAYARVRPIDAAELASIKPFEKAADLLIGERWIRWHYVERRVFGDPRAVMDGIGRSLSRMGGRTT